MAVAKQQTQEAPTGETDARNAQARSDREGGSSIARNAQARSDVGNSV